MKPARIEWLRPAEGDWKVAQREIQAPDPVYNVVCFLSQQCAEKSLKALLEETEIAFGKAHDLVVLLDLTSGRFPVLEELRQPLGYLTPFAIAGRYPGVEAGPETAATALRIASQVRQAVQELLAE
ncbi:MAG: HEPN domain-containing protein [Anaerolineae bacterium]|nr:HEPN domain-containing protein [Anaerolineae bacterium]